MVIEIAAKIPPYDDPKIIELKNELHDDAIFTWRHSINSQTNEKIYTSTSSDENVSY